MNPLLIIIAIVVAAIVLFAIAVYALMRQRNMHLWMRSYCFPPEPRVSVQVETQPVDVFIAVCDHYEPENGGADRSTAVARVQRWCDEYPAKFGQYQDVSGRPPQHTFFFPQDEYQPEYLDMLAELCGAGFGDVDVHLHHKDDTAAALREKLESFRDDLFHRHGLLRRDPVTNEIKYGFIHGNWALCNSLPGGGWCGVNDEITILRETGCYADLTLPSAPSAAQTSTINSIYYAQDKPGQPKSHNTGIRAQVGQTPPDDSLLMIQGPLCLDWANRKAGIIPRTENADLHHNRSASWRRMQMWMNTGVCVAGRPDWIFVKLHTHGCKPGNIDTLLGPDQQQFHADLAEQHRLNPNFRYHYVSAWEMAQLVHQAEHNTTSPVIGTPRTTGHSQSLQMPTHENT